MSESFVDDGSVRSALDRYSDMVFRIAIQYLKNAEDAEDVTQEVFLALLGRSGFEDERHVKAWLIRVAIHKSINLYKRNLKKYRLEGETAKAFSPSVDVSDGELEDALRRLSPKDNLIVYLYYYEGYSAKEIGSFLKMREKAIAKRLSRSRERLKRYLKEGGIDDENQIL